LKNGLNLSGKPRRAGKLPPSELFDKRYLPEQLCVEA